MLQKMAQRPFWFVVGWLITMLQLRFAASLLGMPMQELETFIDEYRAPLELGSWVNGCAALTIIACAILIALHFAGVL